MGWEGGQGYYCLLQKAVLRSGNYLFSAPAPPLSIILALAQAPATAIYCHLNMSYTVLIKDRNYLFFILASSKLTAENIYDKKNFGSGSRSQNNFGSTGSATLSKRLKTRPGLYVPVALCLSSMMKPRESIIILWKLKRDHGIAVFYSTRNHKNADSV